MAIASGNSYSNTNREQFRGPEVDGEAQYVAGKSEQVDGPPQVGGLRHTVGA